MTQALDNPAIPESLRTAAIEAAKHYINVTVAKGLQRKLLVPLLQSGTMDVSDYTAQRRPYHKAEQQAADALDAAIDALAAAS